MRLAKMFKDDAASGFGVVGEGGRGVRGGGGGGLKKIKMKA